MSEFLEQAKKKCRIKPLEEAFIEYPVEEEYHKGKVENIEEYKRRYLEI